MEQTILKLKALADETRLRIMNLFIKSDVDLCVCELMDALQLPQYTVSKSLNILRNAGFFITEREGTWIYYKLNKNAQQDKKIINFLKNYLSSDIFSEDEKRLNDRLKLRENNKCVIGIIPEKKLFRLIKKN